jgi:hypothetical protein
MQAEQQRTTKKSLYEPISAKAKHPKLKGITP